jgi:hypothetical protein
MSHESPGGSTVGRSPRRRTPDEHSRGREAVLALTVEQVREMNAAAGLTTAADDGTEETWQRRINACRTRRLLLRAALSWPRAAASGRAAPAHRRSTCCGQVVGCRDSGPAADEIEACARAVPGSVPTVCVLTLTEAEQRYASSAGRGRSTARTTGGGSSNQTPEALERFAAEAALALVASEAIPAALILDTVGVGVPELAKRVLAATGWPGRT